MGGGWRTAALLMMLVLLGAPLAAADARPPAAVFEDIERAFGAGGAPEPGPADADGEQEQEEFDAAPYDAPVPEAAHGQRLFILEPEADLLPAESWLGLERYGWGEMRIPRLFQYNFRKVVCFYYGRPKSVATSGCGATSMSMVIAYLTGDKAQDPFTLFRWAVNNGMYDGNGLTHEALQEIGALYGVGGRWVAPDEVLVKAALRAGYPVVAHMGPGTFTSRGHYIVLRGLTQGGRILINDPNSCLNSALSFAYEDIAGQLKSDAPFFICHKSEE